MGLYVPDGLPVNQPTLSSTQSTEPNQRRPPTDLSLTSPDTRRMRHTHPFTRRIWVFFLHIHIFQNNLWGCGTGSYRPDVLPDTQPTVSKNWMERKQSTPTSGLALILSHPLLESWWQWHCALYTGSTTPIPDLTDGALCLLWQFADASALSKGCTMEYSYNNMITTSTVKKTHWKVNRKLDNRTSSIGVCETRMWANAQHDGRPIEHRLRPLFNAAKFGWRSLLDCRAVMLQRRESRWNLQGCPKLVNRSQPKFTILWGHVEDILLINKFFSDCRYVS